MSLLDWSPLLVLVTADAEVTAQVLVFGGSDPVLIAHLRFQLLVMFSCALLTLLELPQEVAGFHFFC